jgi:serine protease AprX
MTLGNPLNLVDSSFGPNGTYATALDNNKGSATGFHNNAMTGDAITKVEVLLNGYVPSLMAHDFKIKVWLGGSRLKDFTVSRTLWTSYVGVAKPGQVAIDVTSTRAWNAADFTNTPAITFDFGAFDSKDNFAVDAVGLRITVLRGTTETFTTWASGIGAEETMTLGNSFNLTDSILGPNTTYATALDNHTGSVTGFQYEATPGNAITKVEVLLNGYVPSLMAHDFKIKLWLGGSKLKDFTVSKTLWTSYVGAAKPGLVAIDVTSTRLWKWIDFENNPSISFDFGGFDSKDNFALDAVGLRVTSVPGVDTSLDALTVTNDPDSDIDGSQQVNVYNNVIGATSLWNSTNKLQGKGIGVAVVDSGIYKTKELKTRIKANVNFNPKYHNGLDRYGHGTFVAGILAGKGSESNGKYIGVAPKANLLNVRVADDQGMLYESDVIDALQWVYNNKAKYNIRVVNLSLNSSVAQSYNTSPLSAAVEILWFNGIVVVVSAGNNGNSTIYPPANDPFVITVGATDDKGTVSTADDTMATFSASGVTESGFAKPDLVAPGRMIIGLLPENDKLNMSANRSSNRLDKTYFKMSGTSVSAPMVSGAVALLLQDEPNLTPDQVKYRLMATANKNWSGYNASQAGAGYLNIFDAVYGTTSESANTGILASQLLFTGTNPIVWNSVGWNSVGWNSVGWNSVGWNSVGWNSVGWNSDDWGP